MIHSEWLPDLTHRSGPKYRALLEELRTAISEGVLLPQAKLPPVRDLAWRIGVTPGTVARAYRDGVECGLLTAHVGQGTFVRGAGATGRHLPLLPHSDRVQADQIDLRHARSPNVGQEPDIAAAMRAVLERGAFLVDDYTRASDDYPTRVAIGHWLGRGGIATRPDDVVLTYGTQNSILAALQAVTSGPRPRVLVAQLIYAGFQQAARLAGVELIGVESDEDGILPDAFEKALQTHHPQAALLSANLHNPTLNTLPLDRRHAIADAARQYDIQIIEDDVYGWLEPRTLPSFTVLCPERAWYAMSFSKCMAAGLRIGVLVAPPGHGAQGQAIIQAMSFRISSFIGSTIAELITTGVADQIRARVRDLIAHRSAIVKQHLGEWGVRTRPGANYFWLPLPQMWEITAFDRALTQQGLRVATAGTYVLPGAPVPNAIRCALGMGLDDATFEQTILRIRTVIENPQTELIA